VAGVNGPSAMVVSGDEDAVSELVDAWRERERRVTRLKVSHAFHSHLMDPMLDEFRAVVEGLELERPSISIVSNVTGEVLTAEEACSPDYWVRHVREAVRFMDGIRTLDAQGVTRFLEIGPDGVLAAMAQGCLPDSEPGPVLAATSRRDRGELESLMQGLGELFVAGVAVDWAALCSGGRRVDLPTYAFQHERYWIDLPSGVGDLAAAGQAAAGHPMLGAAVAMAEGDQWLFTGRLSVATHPWLADHAVLDTVFLPGTAHVELALAAGVHVGCEVIEELTLEAPLVLSPEAAVQVQVSVGEPAESGSRSFSIYSRVEQTDEEVPDGDGWIRHGAGVLSPASSAESADGPLGAWPPEGAQPIETDDLYDRLADLGFTYGPAFQGLRAAWRRGDELYAEVGLPEGEADDAGRYGVHPALLDAGFHAGAGIWSEEGTAEQGKPPLPFAWGGVRLRTAGASVLRMSLISTDGGGTHRIVGYDEMGDLVLSVERLASRPIDISQLAAAQQGSDSLFRVDWVELEDRPGVSAADNGSGSGSAAVIGLDARALDELASAGTPVPEVVFATVDAQGDRTDVAVGARGAARRALGLLQTWLGDARFADSRLVLVTGGAVAVGDGEPVDLGAASVWGLVRSALSEHPGRFGLLDLDLGADLGSGGGVDLPSAAAAMGDEPQLAVRDGRALAPRLVRAEAGEARESATFDPLRTVLVTGGTGGLGALFARHLVAEHDVGHLLLISRRGPDAEGAAELVAELEALGAEVRVEACDVTDRGRLEELLASIPDGHPLGAVVHTAGVLDDGTIETLDGDRLDRVMAPKADAAWHLHQLTEQLDLSAFVMFSSAAATLGSPGQGSYAAGNAFLDALAQQRRSAGLAAQSLAWGLWDRKSGMGGGLDEEARERMGRMGFAAISDEEGVGLFDSANDVDAPLLVAVSLDRAGLRALVQAGIAPQLLRGLVRVSARRAEGGAGSFARQLVQTPTEEWAAVVLEAVRAQAAVVLGHASADAIEAERPLLELGLDSLGAVELRNRLIAASGVPLEPTIAFDYPSVAALAGYLLEKLEQRVVQQGAVEAAEVAGGDTAETGGTLGELLRHAREQEAIPELVPLLLAAGSFRPAFRSLADQGGALPATTIASGRSEPRLICVPSFLAGSGAHQFARLAREFERDMSVAALSLPGFRRGELLPGSWEAVVESLVESIRATAGDGRFILAGYSIGGAVAYALAERLERDGVAVDGVVMIDTYAPESDELSGVFAAVMAAIVDRDSMGLTITDDGLIAMGRYMQLFSEWSPASVEAPTLLVRAAEAIPGMGYEDPSWGSADSVAEVPGNHFDVIEEHADGTARVIEEWISERVPDGGAVVAAGLESQASERGN
jgi:NAD(P)-dependent dehydrogenase (short-subunit alcohol dehydrogenase family)/acyl carrier protein